MADQVGPGTLGGALTGGGAGSQQVARPGQAGATGTMEHHHGRPVSWVAVVIILIGFVVGGLAMIFGPTWWLVWVGGGIVVVGGILSLATGIFNDWY
jgi:hypothetical protein